MPMAARALSHRRIAMLVLLLLPLSVALSERYKLTPRALQASSHRCVSQLTQDWLRRGAGGYF